MSAIYKLMLTLISCGLLYTIASAGAPVASFSVEPSSGHAPLTVSFKDTSTGFPTAWAWYFGDEDYQLTQWVGQNGSAPWNGRFGHSSVALPDGSIVLMGGGGG